MALILTEYNLVTYAGEYLKTEIILIQIVKHHIILIQIVKHHIKILLPDRMIDICKVSR